jgi:hypothetical protein
MNSFKIKISKEKKELFKQFTTLQKLPKTDENKLKIKEKRQEIKASVISARSARLISPRGTTTGVFDGEDSVLFRSYDGEIYWAKGPSTGKNLRVTIVYYKFDFSSLWHPYVLSTKLTQVEGEELFDGEAFEDDIDAYNCGLNSVVIYENDNSTNYPEFFDDEDEIFANLGIGNNKAFFNNVDAEQLETDLDFYLTPEQFLNGQEVIIANNYEDLILGRIKWDINKTKITITGWLLIGLVILVAVNLLTKIPLFNGK